MTVIYIDILFLMNFAMDYITLYFTGVILHFKMTKLRLVLSSFLLGIYAVWGLLFCRSYLLLLTTSIPAILAAILFSYCIKGIKRIIRALVVVFLIGGLLGGILTAMFGVLIKIIGENNSYIAADHKVIVFTCIGILSGLCIWFGRKLLAGSVEGCVVNGEVSIDVYTASFSFLIDSGNTAQDPISGYPVVILNEQCFAQLFVMEKDSPAFLPSKRRIVCINSVGGKRVLPGFIAEYLKIGQTKFNCVIAFDTQNSFQYYDGIVPSAFVR